MVKNDDQVHPEEKPVQQQTADVDTPPKEKENRAEEVEQIDYVPIVKP